MKEAPATTEGSSIAIGTSTSRPLTRKFKRDAQRQGVQPDHVLDHVIGLSQGQAARLPCKAAPSSSVMSALPGQFFQAFRQA